MKEEWNKRYNSHRFIYGRKPNKYIADKLVEFSPGKILFPAESEGRNAIFAAQNQWQPTAVDFSEIAIEKAKRWAKSAHLDIRFITHDFITWPGPKFFFDVVAVTFLHLPRKYRPDLHKKLIEYIKPGGHLLMEVFHTNQLTKNSGGPRKQSMLYTTEEIAKDFAQIHTHQLIQKKVNLDEGSYHQGPADVIQYWGQKTV